MGEPRSRNKPQGAAMRALRGARDLYVRGLRGLDRLLAAASPRRAGVGRPTSRVFRVGSGDRESEEVLLQELVRAMQARRGTAASTGADAGSGTKEAEAGTPAVKRRGVTRLERINEDAAVVHPTS